jgi:carboxylate-amine ligase
VGDAQKLTPDEQLAFARESFDGADDLTLAVEEEFALLDADTFELTNTFEELQAAAAGTELEEHLVGELIASEIEIKTGRCTSFGEAADKMVERRAQLGALVDPHGIALASTGTHPWSRWQDQRIIDTPHYRRNNEILQYVVWRNNSFGVHVHIGVRGADRAIAVCNAFRNVLPELLAVSASSPFVEDVVTGLHSARTQIFTRMFPRCGIPDAYEDWEDFERYVRLLYSTSSIDEHTQLWWSVRPHLAFPTIEVRICDAQPDVADAQALAALIYALGARFARALDEGEPLPAQPRRLLEENLWRAIRTGLSGEMIDLERGDAVATRRR